MTFLRSTEGASNRASLINLQGASGRLDALQTKLSSGRQITKPSDDPAGTVRALQLRQSLARMEQYKANAAYSTGWLTAADAAYSGAVTLTQKARTLVVQGLNSGALDDSARTAIANQIDALRSSLIGTANSVYNGRPVFGGTTTGDIAYDPSGAYVGDAGVLERTVADGAIVQISQTGPDAFGPAGSDIFATLSAASTALRNNDMTALKAQLADVDTGVSRISAAQATQGAAYNRIQQTQAALTTTQTGLKTELSNLQDIDIAEMAVQVTTANTTYQAALQTTAAIKQLSLLDFLR